MPFSQQVKQEPKKAGAAPGIFTWWGITGKMCISVIDAIAPMMSAEGA